MLIISFFTMLLLLSHCPQLLSQSKWQCDNRSNIVKNKIISMSWAWDKEKIWVPNRIQTYDLPNTRQVLYPLDLRRTHGEGGHKLYYRVYVQILPSFILSPKVPLFSNPKNIIPCSPQSESTVCISFTLPLFNEHYLINRLQSGQYRSTQYMLQ